MAQTTSTTTTTVAASPHLFAKGSRLSVSDDGGDRGGGEKKTLKKSGEGPTNVGLADCLSQEMEN